MPGRSYDLVRQTPGGNPGDGTVNGNVTLKIGSSILFIGKDSAVPSGNVQAVTTDGASIYVRTNGSGGVNLDPSGKGTTFGGGGQMSLSGNPVVCIRYKGVLTQGYGLSPIYGYDARTGLTAVDSAAKTLYTTTAAGQLYRLMGRILATAGTSPSATYTIKWTEGGATITKTLTISAIDSDSDLSILIQPDNGTAITAQLTAISGTGTTVNVAATVEEMA